MRKKAFTLIEILIALVIVAILFTLIFRAYVSITQISTRLQNEKRLNAEITYVTETVQNIADTYQIDFVKYGSSLFSGQGWTKILYLTGAGDRSGAILMFSGANLLWIHAGTTTELVSSGTALLSAGTFRVIPYVSGTTFLDVQHPGFWLFTDMRLLRYNATDWVWNVQASMQQFYNLQRVE